MTDNDEKEMLRVILCKPGEYAEVIEIDGTLESMQHLVGGLIKLKNRDNEETELDEDDITGKAKKHCTLKSAKDEQLIFTRQQVLCSKQAQLYGWVCF